MLIRFCVVLKNALFVVHVVDVLLRDFVQIATEFDFTKVDTLVAAVNEQVNLCTPQTTFGRSHKRRNRRINAIDTQCFANRVDVRETNIFKGVATPRFPFGQVAKLAKIHLALFTQGFDEREVEMGVKINAIRIDLFYQRYVQQGSALLLATLASGEGHLARYRYSCDLCRLKDKTHLWNYKNKGGIRSRCMRWYGLRRRLTDQLHGPHPA